jgi:antitoxin component YwqK of YwqJK toxin-antitoxin module
MKKLLIILAIASLSANYAGAQSNDISMDAAGKFITATGEYFNGNLETFYMGGQIESIYECNDGVKDGKITVFYANGVTKEVGSFNNGVKTGEWIEYSADGKITSIAFYKNNIKHGTWKVWDAKGVLRS